MNIFLTECKKWKRSPLSTFLVCLFIILVITSIMHTFDSNTSSFSHLSYLLLFDLNGALLPVSLGLCISMLFIAEQQNNTLKLLFSIPVSKSGFYWGKIAYTMLVSFLLCCSALLCTILLSLCFGYSDINLSTLSFVAFIYTINAILSTFAMLPICLITVIFGNYLFSIGATILYLLVGSGPFALLHPYSAKEILLQMFISNRLQPAAVLLLLFLGLVGFICSTLAIRVLNKQSN